MMNTNHHIKVLDGWRGISILCVLAGHMVPLAGFNGAIATTGMSLFFILSGFLIVSMLLRDQNVSSFLIRRVCRIVPLAWPVLALLLIIGSASAAAWTFNLLFFANLPPYYLGFRNAHFWSLCVEMQFYVSIAALVFLFGRRALFMTPVLCLCITTARIWTGEFYSIVTWLRLDDILAGGSLALVLAFDRPKTFLSGLPQWLTFALLPLLIACSHPDLSSLNYGRPYVAALIVASTLYRRGDLLHRTLSGKTLGYVAAISYALYVIHPLTTFGWFSEGAVIIKGLKRLLSIGISFAFAHLSTTLYENWWIALGHRLSKKMTYKFRYAA